MARKSPSRWLNWAKEVQRRFVHEGVKVAEHCSIRVPRVFCLVQRRIDVPNRIHAGRVCYSSFRTITQASGKADTRYLSFVPTEVMAQFVEVSYPNLSEKQRLPIIRCLSQGIDKEGNSRHFIRLNWLPIH
jgi:hypothetical protein